MDDQGDNAVNLFDVGEDKEAQDEMVIAFGTPAFVFIIDCSSSMIKPVNYLLTAFKVSTLPQNQQ